MSFASLSYLILIAFTAIKILNSAFLIVICLHFKELVTIRTKPNVSLYQSTVDLICQGTAYYFGEAFNLSPYLHDASINKNYTHVEKLRAKTPSKSRLSLATTDRSEVNGQIVATQFIPLNVTSHCNFYYYVL